jgi:PilZ domain-containing protein
MSKRKKKAADDGASAAADANADRRRHPRLPVTWRIKFWLDEKVGYITAKTSDVSTGGLGIVLSGRLTSLLRRGARYRVEVEAGDQSVVDEMTIRYADGERVGLQFDRELPLVAALATLDASKAATMGTLTGQL